MCVVFVWLWSAVCLKVGQSVQEHCRIQVLLFCCQFTVNFRTLKWRYCTLALSANVLGRWSLTWALYRPYVDPPLIQVPEVSLDQWFAGGRGTKRSWTWSYIHHCRIMIRCRSGAMMPAAHAFNVPIPEAGDPRGTRISNRGADGKSKCSKRRSQFFFSPAGNKEEALKTTCHMTNPQQISWHPW